ncbi:3'(2'),5'-bisphosphate nucleotidase CysQ [Candidatus Altiarchaeota archaeon]
MLEDIDVEKLIEISHSAGQEILKVYDGDFKVEYKQDKSPLTAADKGSNDVINEALTNLYPDIPILSEENKSISYDERRSWDMLWIVDPLDGTKEFVKRNGEFTVNIGLVKDGIPVFGVVYVPVTDTVYYTGKGQAFKVVGDEPPARCPLDLERDASELVVVASRSHMSAETEEFIKRRGKDYESTRMVASGSSIKMCLVAEGSADVYPRLAPTMEWDTCAAHAVVLASGKDVTGYGNGESLRYNKEDLLNPWFVVE